MEEIYNLYKLSSIFSVHSKILQWLRDIELIPTVRYCPTHKKILHYMNRISHVENLNVSKRTNISIISQKTHGSKGATFLLKRVCL